MKHIEVVVGILRHDHKVLVAQRPEGKPYSGFWEFPGGKIENNEMDITALKRELYEELAIEVLSADKWFEHLHDYPDKVVNLKLYVVHQYQGSPSPQEGQSIAWVDYKTLCQMNILQGNIALLDRLNSLMRESL